MVDQHATFRTPAQLSDSTNTGVKCTYSRRVRSYILLHLRALLKFRSAQWGFHPGGWGKPPLDEYNRPLYGDVFGILPKAGDAGVSYAVLTLGLCTEVLFLDGRANR